MHYIITNGGIDTEADYPYVAKDDKCSKKKANRCSSAPCSGHAHSHRPSVPLACGARATRDSSRALLCACSLRQQKHCTVFLAAWCFTGASRGRGALQLPCRITAAQQQEQLSLGALLWWEGATRMRPA